MSKLKDIRSKWCHPDDRAIVRAYVDSLNYERNQQKILKESAIAIRNFSEVNFFVADIVVVKNRTRCDVDYASKGRLCQAGKNQIIKQSDLNRAK